MRRPPRQAAAPDATGAPPPTKADALILLLCGVVLQYVWRVQEVLRPLAWVQFTSVVSVGAIVLFALDPSPLRRLSNLRRGMFRPIAIIFVMALLSIPGSFHTRVSYDFFTKNFVKTVVLVAILAASVRDRRDVNRLLRALVLGGAGYVGAGLLLAVPGMGRLAGTGGAGSYDPNDLGLVTVCTIPICVYMMRREAPRFDRIVAFVAVILLLIATVMTGSRGGFLALVAVAGYALLAFRAVKLSRRLTILALAGTALVGVGGAAYMDRIATLADPTEDYNWSGQAESGRIEIWKRGLRYIAQHPVLGVGVDAFFIAEGNSPEALARRAQGAGFKWSAAHNSYIQIGAELGVIGLLSFVTLLVMAFRETRRIARMAARREDRLLAQCFGALLVGYVIAAAFLSQAYSTFLYFTLGILIGFSRVISYERARSAAPSPAPEVTPSSRQRVVVSRRAAARLQA